MLELHCQLWKGMAQIKPKWKHFVKPQKHSHNQYIKAEKGAYSFKTFLATDEQLGKFIP